MASGEIVRWNRARGFGFIKVAGQADDVFLHISQWPRDIGEPKIGQQVGFTLARDEQGRLRAEQVQVNGAVRALKSTKTSPPKRALNGTFNGASNGLRQLSPVKALWLVGGLGVVVLVAAFIYWRVSGGGFGHSVLVMWYAGISALSFAAFGWDKLQAQTGGWRTRETTLYALALIGGWPGGILAMRFFRHKTQKLSFQLVFWLAVIANIYLLSGDQLQLLGRGLRF